MEMHFEDLGATAKVCLIGRLDSPGVDRIETRFLAALAPAGKNAIVDLGQVSFVSSMGIRMLLGAARALKLKNARLVLFGAQPLVEETLAQTIKMLIPVVSNEQEAQKFLRSA